MTITRVRPEDLVLVDKRGREFVALVVANDTPRQLEIAPIDRRITYRTAAAHEVIGHWRKPPRSRVPHIEL